MARSHCQMRGRALRGRLTRFIARRCPMNPRLVVPVFALLVGFIAVGVSTPPSTAAGASANSEKSKIRRGFQIAPVTLNLHGKNRSLVGLGSYIVNAQGGCNDCHTNPSYADGHDPFKGEPEQINTANYLAGGRAFGPVVSA